MRRVLEVGGVIAAVVLVAFGVGAIALGFGGIQTVNDSLAKERIVGSDNMTPEAVAAEVEAAGLTGIDLPTCNVAGETIDTGDEARCFAEYVRIHALEAGGGYTYSQMGRLEAAADAPAAELAEGGGTNNAEFAAIDAETGEPLPNAARELWVTATALTTALNASFMASQVGLFGIVVGVALLLTGLGFAVLVASGAVRDPGTILRFLRPKDQDAA